ncbi:hypothetical protein HUJ04_001421 [Dendroctonus ponderosae]|nr:hypothetical protein HUJ04_001421 [Dendroctonus ponderosae]
MLGKVPLHVGIHEHLFSHINESIEGSAGRCCVLLFDEMDIQENIEYDFGSDNILGFEDFGGRTSSKPANKGLLVMLAGLAKNWKQPVAHLFANNGGNANNLEHCLFQVLKADGNKELDAGFVRTACSVGGNGALSNCLLNERVKNFYYSSITFIRNEEGSWIAFSQLIKN